MRTCLSGQLAVPDAVAHERLSAQRSTHQLLRDGRMSLMGRSVHGRSPIISLKINVTASFNQLFRDKRMPIYDSDEKRSDPMCVSIPILKIHVTARFDQVIRDGHIPSLIRDVERVGSLHLLVVDQRLHAFRRHHLPQSLYLHTQTLQNPCALPKVMEVLSLFIINR